MISRGGSSAPGKQKDGKSKDGKSKKRLMLSIVLILVFSSALTVYYKKNFEWTEVEVEGPISESARKHHFLAASRFITRLGYHTSNIESAEFFSNYPPVTDTIVLMTIPDLLTESALERMLDWINDGGHLIVGLDPNGSSDAARDFLYTLGVVPTIDFNAYDEYSIFQVYGGSDTEPLEVEMYLEHQFDVYSELPLSRSGGVEDLLAFAQFPHQNGLVTVFAEPYLWANIHIAGFDHAKLFKTVVADHASTHDTIHISDTSIAMPGVFSLLWNQFKYLCLILVVIGLALLRRSTVRFGPIQQHIEPRSNNFARHLQATAQFRCRYQSGNTVLEATRKQLLSKFAGTKQKNVTPDNAAQKTELVTGIQRGIDLTSEQIESALFDSNIQRKAILPIVQSLQTIKRSAEK